MHPAHQTTEQWLAAFSPMPGEQDDYERMRALLVTSTMSPSPFLREHVTPGHFTASAFVLSPDDDSLLLIFHGKLHRWLQPGGHIESGDADVVSAARREASEECGIAESELELIQVGQSPIFDVDIHRIPPHKGEAAHDHLDIRILFRSATLDIRAGSDAKDAKFTPLTHVVEEETDASVMRAVKKVLER